MKIEWNNITCSVDNVVADSRNGDQIALLIPAIIMRVLL